MFCLEIYQERFQKFKAHFAYNTAICGIGPANMYTCISLHCSSHSQVVQAVLAMHGTKLSETCHIGTVSLLCPTLKCAILVNTVV